MAGISSRTQLSGNTIGDTDLFLISKDNGNGTFTSLKVAGSQMKTGLDKYGKIGIPDQTTGSFTYYSTLESARDAAVSGDTIMVYPGTYTVTTTAANGLGKNGVSYYFHPNTTVNKATSGHLFSDNGFTANCNVYGHGVFNKTTSTGKIYYNTLSNGIFEARTVTSTIDDCFLTTVASNLYFNVKFATCSGGRVLNMAGYSSSLVKIDMISWRSTASNCIGVAGWWYNTDLQITGELLESTTGQAIGNYNTGVRLNLNITRILGVTYALSSGDGGSGDPQIVNCSYCTGISDVGKNYIVNGQFANLNYSAFNTLSYIKGGRFNTITLSGGSIKTTLGAFAGSSSGSITQSGGVLDVDIDSFHYGFGFNITGGICNIRSHASQIQLSVSSERIVNGGTLNLYTSFTHGGSVDNGLWYAIKLQSGILRLFSNIYNTFDYSGNGTGVEGAHGILWLGGKLIIENSTIVTTNTLSYPIKAAVTGLQLRVNGRLSHNRTQHGTLLSGKKHKCKYVVNSVATTAIYCNDGTGGDELFQVTNTTTYNTTAAIAARMVELINASSTLDMTALQDNPGTDTYFYVEMDTPGYNFNIRGNTNVVTNLTTSISRIGSYAFTELVGGTIIESSNVE
jgi:hypothetical protein